MKTLLHNKKGEGEDVLSLIFRLVITLSVIAIAFVVARAAGESDRVERALLADTLRAMLEQAASHEGDVDFSYHDSSDSFELSDYRIVLTDRQLTISLAGEGNAVGTRRRVVLPESLELVGAIEGEEQLCIHKRGSVISVDACELEALETTLLVETQEVAVRQSS